MKIQTNFLQVKTLDTSAINERFSIEVDVATDLLARASRAISKALVCVSKEQYLKAAESAGQAMMLARQAEIILLCALAAERASLSALAEQLSAQQVEAYPDMPVPE
jgi:hypothetical protein